ncbi:hypothetical protein K458DRAFT_121186 [Lentithecium fluviatile CBS 122367]|uniref:Uncharacterized protein n=1 Tax=Lentithecium fluviatile CBS 122367 TaxID=1168545 RepID=A0A6G1ILZ2_9PLEO|nr:hypothetical protein K458DRAFT_121186 [Lentithecium fluviatile CBS 122367]
MDCLLRVTMLHNVDGNYGTCTVNSYARSGVIPSNHNPNEILAKFPSHFLSTNECLVARLASPGQSLRFKSAPMRLASLPKIPHGLSSSPAKSSTSIKTFCAQARSISALRLPKDNSSSVFRTRIRLCSRYMSNGCIVGSFFRRMALARGGYR